MNGACTQATLMACRRSYVRSAVVQAVLSRSTKQPRWPAAAPMSGVLSRRPPLTGSPSDLDGLPPLLCQVRRRAGHPYQVHTLSMSGRCVAKEALCFRPSPAAAPMSGVLSRRGRPPVPAASPKFG
jgi:hypothetical protein